MMVFCLQKSRKKLHSSWSFDILIVVPCNFSTMLLLSTASLRGYGLHRIFAFARDIGFDGISLDLDQTQFDTENFEYLSGLSKEFSLPIVSVSAYERKMDTDSVDRTITLATKLKAKNIVFSPPHRLDKDTAWFTGYLPEAAKASKVTCSVINMEPKTFLFIIPEYKDATLESIKKVTGKTALSISNVDPESGVDLMRTFAVLGNSITNVLLNDRSGSKEELLPGRGDAPVESLLVKLKDAGYKGIFTLKVNPKELEVGNDSAVIKHLTEAKAYYEKYV